MLKKKVLILYIIIYVYVRMLSNITEKQINLSLLSNQVWEHTTFRFNNQAEKLFKSMRTAQ